MEPTQAAQIDRRITPIFITFATYINFIVVTEQNFPGSVGLTLSGKALSPSDRGDVAQFVYTVMQNLAQRIMWWSGKITFESAYVYFFIVYRTDPDFNKRSTSWIAEFVESTFRKECEGLLSLQTTLNFDDVCGLVRI